jgi:nucleoside-diphosphate-sugar epimerase
MFMVLSRISGISIEMYLGIWMYQYHEQEPMTIFGDGSQTRAFSYIDDNLEPFWNAATFTSSI